MSNPIYVIVSKDTTNNGKQWTTLPNNDSQKMTLLPMKKRQLTMMRENNKTPRVELFCVGVAS